MAPAAKRRKVASTSRTQTFAPSSQTGIQAFGKITKAQAQFHVKSASGTQSSLKGSCDSSVGETELGRKRKFDSIESVSKEEKDLVGRLAPATVSKNSALEDLTVDGKVGAHTAIQKKKHWDQNAFVGRFPETPKKGTRSLLGDLALQSFTPNEHISSPPDPQVVSSNDCVRDERETIQSSHTYHKLPPEIQDLINLHSSFLTALFLHYAHNGSMTPADLRNLAPGIERIWRKRKVTTEDVCRILALERRAGEKNGSLDLADYGHSKICIEISENANVSRTQKRPFSEEALNARFNRNLERQWSCYRAAHPSTSCPTAFISSLPALPIKPCSSLAKIGPLLSKGQRRLEDLKSGAIKAQQTPLRSTTGNANASPKCTSKQPSTRSTDLFSRLAAKKLDQSTLPAPPTPDHVARQSALQRLHEVAPILESLAASSKKHCDDDADAEEIRQRVTHASFTMPTLVQHLQMSLRNPIGKEEAVRCIRLLAEILPEWVGLRTVGKLSSVTVRGNGVGRDELKRRVDNLLDGRQKSENGGNP